MLILENTLKFSGNFITRAFTRRTVIHHSASGPTTTIEDIHRWHLAKEWAGIGYHYVIYFDGSIHRGRPEWAKGAHAYQDPQHDANSDGIGICLIGDFTKAVPTEAQMVSLIWLVHDIWSRYPGIPVIGHKDVMPTACPGDRFPWLEIKRRLEAGPMPEQWKLEIIAEAKKEGIITTDHNPDDPATKWFVLAICINMLKIVRKMIGGAA